MREILQLVANIPYRLFQKDVSTNFGILGCILTRQQSPQNFAPAELQQATHIPPTQYWMPTHHGTRQRRLDKATCARVDVLLRDMRARYAKGSCACPVVNRHPELSGHNVGCLLGFCRSKTVISSFHGYGAFLDTGWLFKTNLFASENLCTSF